MKKKARKRSFDTAIQVHAKRGLFLCERLVFVSVCTQTVYSKSIETTVWKFQHFSVIQILHEINFGGTRSS